ncbi:Cold regulated protein 27, putative isoform 4 [Hibiscus syriacus]|uniref:Cold regulated protein 27, putative isoform 4 n=1 Tax=Hibiscus syriacus TaxID=106335 RepID=A0A6A3CIN4_HIBSY|nr:cold-regulated protein 27-like [Hibiscus syriacus]KAE8729180.1 Cold regulated protein 27, putative isoform 4 [Hibiscus syriacus]
MEGFRRIESRTSSESSASELTPQTSPEFAQNPSLDSLITESTSTEWTDEKHSLYLKSMEASFVNQLYDSMSSLGWNSKDKLPGSKSSRKTHCISSGQFKVIRGGCWKKINFERPGFQLNKRDGSHSFVASPWIQHFRSRPTSCGISASCSLQDNASSKEVSDQNFIDEKQGESTGGECGLKKLKTLVTDASYNDQVVP